MLLYSIRVFFLLTAYTFTPSDRPRTSKHSHALISNLFSRLSIRHQRLCGLCARPGLYHLYLSRSVHTHPKQTEGGTERARIMCCNKNQAPTYAFIAFDSLASVQNIQTELWSALSMGPTCAQFFISSLCTISLTTQRPNTFHAFPRPHSQPRDTFHSCASPEYTHEPICVCTMGRIVCVECGYK